MKSVFASWEIRNIGCRTLEMTIEKEDTRGKLLEEIKSLQEQYNAEYLVVKNNAKYATLNAFFQNIGFSFMEVQLSLKVDRKSGQEAVNKGKMLFPEYSYYEAGADDLERVLTEIKKGVFVTDRIALDPKFGIEKANERYAYWVKDAYEQGADLIITKYEGHEIGFSLSKNRDDKIRDCLLIGGYENQWSHGLGGMLLQTDMEKFLNSGRRNKKTAVSSNNPNILKLHLTYKNQITDINTVFVFHGRL